MKLRVFQLTTGQAAARAYFSVGADAFPRKAPLQLPLDKPRFAVHSQVSLLPLLTHSIPGVKVRSEHQSLASEQGVRGGWGTCLGHPLGHLTRGSSAFCSKRQD